MSIPALAFIGGTGAEGRGLASRFARSGHPVRIGSRDAARAEQAASTLQATLPEGADVWGGGNAEAVAAADIAVLTVPYEAQRATLEGLRGGLAGKIVITAVVPMEFRAGQARAIAVAEGSAAEQAQALLPQSRVIGAFHHVSARKLAKPGLPVEGDCLVFGDDAEAKATVIALVEEIEGLRPVDAGGLAAAYPVEIFTAALVSINRVHRLETGVRIAGLREAP